MKKISAYLTNYTAPSSGFSEGRLKDDPGDGTGSGITVNTHNDFLYGFLAPIIKWVGAVSETDESETASDMLTAIEYAAGVANENVSEWSNSTTYDTDDEVMYLGIQFVSMKTSNTGNNPIDSPIYWLPCFSRDEAIRKFRDGHNIEGGFAPLHNKRDATNYREYFKWGKYNFGGASGRNFQAYGVHLDGQTLTGDADYEAIFNIGETDEYHLLDTIAPEVTGTRTLLDSKGRVPRITDATSGSTVDVGSVQADAFQGHRFEAKFSMYAAATGDRVTDGTGQQSIAYGRSDGTGGNAVTTSYPRATDWNLITDTVNGTPRTSSETRMKNFSVGLQSVLVLVEI